MNKEIIFGVIGGLGLFIYGIHLMGEGLQRAAGDKLRNILKALTTNTIMGALVGAVITAIIQSSSATTVMVVGFVNAGLMTLAQSIGVILGANIGTTVTAQIIAFKLTDYALPVVAVGAGFFLFSGKRFWRFLGLSLLGFGVLFLGLGIMSSSVKPLAQNPKIIDAFVNLNQNVFLAILLGIVATAVVQSSSVTTGIVLTLASLGLLDLNGALPIIMGANIGTCVTALLASIGTGISARRAAVAHILFNTIGVIIFLFILKPFITLVSLTSGDIARQCANAHTVFNLTNTLIFLPFVPLYANLIKKLVPGKESVLDSGPHYLEKHLLNTPLVALDAATREIIRMADLAKEMVNDAMGGFIQSDERLFKKLPAKERVLDSLQEAITNYLMALTEHELSPEQARKIPALLHSVNDLERIGDHSENLMELAQRKIESNLPFTQHAIDELNQMRTEINLMTDQVIKALGSNLPEDARLVLATEDRVNRLTDQLRQNHIRRLNQGECKVLSGIVFLDLISNFEKMGDHLTNVAQAVMGRLQWESTHDLH